MSTDQVRVVCTASSELGEGPLWSARRAGIFWVDILGKRLHFYSLTKGHESWAMPKMSSAVAECEDGQLVIALQDEVVKFNTADGAMVHITLLDTDRPQNRSNDGKCDANGNFWIGTMQHEPTESCGRLWCVKPSGEKIQVLDDIGIANTLAWDANRNRFYFADSMRGELYCFDLTADMMPSNKRIFASAENASWTPDGSTLDTEGYLWNAQWDASRVVRYAPDGAVDRIIALPVKRPTSCTFGGTDLTTLFITSARSDDPDDALGGALLAVETSHPGFPAALFGG